MVHALLVIIASPLVIDFLSCTLYSFVVAMYVLGFMLVFYQQYISLMLLLQGPRPYKELRLIQSNRKSSNQSQVYSLLSLMYIVVIDIKLFI